LELALFHWKNGNTIHSKSTIFLYFFDIKYIILIFLGSAMSYLSEPVTFNNYQEILFNPDNEKHEKQIALRIINAFLEKAKS